MSKKPSSIGNLHWRGYGSFYNYSEGFHPVLIDSGEQSKFGSSLSLTMLSCVKFSSMVLRDSYIARFSEINNIKSAIDIGGDIGNLALQLKNKGISVSVIEPNQHCNNTLEKLQIEYKNLFVEDLIKEKQNLKVDLITCLNFTHVEWKEENLKRKFFSLLNNSGAEFIIFSHYGRIPPQLCNYEEVPEFNPFSKKYSYLKLVEKVLRRLRLRSSFLEFIIGTSEYIGMQRMLRRKP